MSDNIMPMLSKLLKDEIVEVQYAAVEHLDKIILLSCDDNDITNKYILPVIKEGMTNKKWRFRFLVAENLAKVVGKLTKDKIMNELFSIIVQLFNDHAAEIRKETWKICEEIENKVYPGFIREKIWELQKQKFGSKNYILRIASMKSIDYLKKYYKKSELIDEIIPQIVEMAKQAVEGTDLSELTDKQIEGIVDVAISKTNVTLNNDAIEAAKKEVLSIANEQKESKFAEEMQKLINEDSTLDQLKTDYNDTDLINYLNANFKIQNIIINAYGDFKTGC